MLGARTGERSDAILLALLFTGTVLYVWWQPRTLGVSDEAVYLYEAKRVLAGQVMYRDVFEIITPGWVWLMALLFRVFGTTLATARTAIAVVHGVTGVLVYLTCRRLGVRRALAWPPAVAYVAVCQSAWPIASQHWLATLLFVMLLWTLVGARPDRAGTMIAPGVAGGLLIAVQQPRGVAMAVGVVAWLVADEVIRRRFRPPLPAAPLAPRLGAFAAGGAAIVVPVLAIAVAGAGIEPVWRALVVHPIVNYGGTTRCEWGHLNVMTAWNGTFTFPRLLKWLPVVLVPVAARLAWLLVAARDGRTARTLALLLVFSVASMLSITYFPDFIHIAFIAPVFFVAIAETAEWALALVPAPATVRAVVAVAGAVFLVACALHLRRNLVRLEETFSIVRDTAFGRVRYGNPVEVDLYDRIAAALRDAPSRELFCYPIMANLYLTVNADNPTPYGFFIAGYNAPDQVEEVIGILDAKKLPYLVVLPAVLKKDDPILAYVERHYEPVDGGTPAGQAIFRRKAASAMGTS